MAERHTIVSEARGEPLPSGRVGVRLYVPLSGSPSGRWSRDLSARLTTELTGQSAVGYLRLNDIVQGDHIVLEGVEEREASNRRRAASRRRRDEQRLRRPASSPTRTCRGTRPTRSRSGSASMRLRASRRGRKARVAVRGRLLPSRPSLLRRSVRRALREIAPPWSASALASQRCARLRSTWLGWPIAGAGSRRAGQPRPPGTDRPARAGRGIARRRGS